MKGKNMKPIYPNLELIEYIFKQKLIADDTWKEKYEKLKEKQKYIFLDFDIQVFPQIWGSTCTAFDVCSDGSPAIGGCAITKAYTTVIHEHITDTYGIFIDNRPCYMVWDPTENFLKDLKKQKMKSLREAKKYY